MLVKLSIPTLKGLTSGHKLRTWVYLQVCFAWPCVHLRWLAMTCTHFGQDQSFTEVNASFSPFGHPTQVNVRWVMPFCCYSNLLANEIQDMYVAPSLWCFFLPLACTCKSLHRFNLRLLATTCETFWPGLKSIGVRAPSDLGGQWPSRLKNLHNAWMRVCWNQDANALKLHEKQKCSQFPHPMKKQ